MEHLACASLTSGTQVADSTVEEDWVSGGCEIEMGTRNLAEVEGRSKK